MENNTPSQSGLSPRWLIALILLTLGSMAGYWYYNQPSTTEDTKFAFASNHYFEDPDVFFGGKGLRYEILKNDPRMLKVYVPLKDLDAPRYLLAEDGELDFLGFVKKDQLFIPLQLFQIHNDRPGPQNAPVSDCKTYLQVAAQTDTILVEVDDKYVLRGTKVGPDLYAIPFCETTREHHFKTLGLYGQMALKGQAPATYSTLGLGPGSSDFRYRLRGSGDTIRMSGLMTPGMYSSATATQAELLQEKRDIGVTEVTLTLPRQVTSPWVYLNDRRFTDFKLNSARNQLRFQVKTSDQLLKIRVGDATCECSASGYPRRNTLELAGFCECRDVLVNVNLDPGLDRYRSKIRIYIDGQLSDLRLPPVGQPMVFQVRKTGQDQFVALKLVMVDDTGRTGLMDVCSFTVPTETTTSTISPACHCAECPANIKVSGK
ncbi:MAG: hypothetical protein IT260_06295 [Saprospiraceae bacterium]|nr:hypothetical protein [Saprospiraceae bacterium]